MEKHYFQLSSFSRNRQKSLAWCGPLPATYTATTFSLRTQTSNYATAQSALESSRNGEKPTLLRRQLEVLRQHIKDESVDLIYIDPPFNSRQDCNVLFAEKDGTRPSSQIMAFEDTWEWSLDAG
jgi:16S rRNA G966 N2-methylase RsmD